MGRRPKKEIEKEPLLDHAVRKSITAIVLIAFALIFLLSLLGLAGMVGEKIDGALALAFGWGRYFFPIVLAVIAAFYFKKEDTLSYYLSVGGVIMFFVAMLGIIHLFYDLDEMLKVAKAGEGAGFFGYITAYVSAKYLGKIAGTIILLAIWLTGLVLAFNFPLHKIIEWLNEMRQRRAMNGQQEDDEEEQEDGEDEPADGEKEAAAEEDLPENIKKIEFVEGPSHLDDENSKKKNNSSSSSSELNINKRNIYAGLDWELPPLDLLEGSLSRPKPSNLHENAEIIRRTLHNFGIEVEIGECNVGPTVTQYTFKPAIGVKLSKILSLQSDLALALAAHPIRIEAPIPGKSLVGVEVPNKTKAMVRMRNMFESDVFQNRASNLSIVLGEDVNGEPVIGNIEKMPHLMIAGSTGTGKSVGINSILIALLCQNSPEELRLILVDPKRVELSLYNDIPHLLTPVIVDTSKVVNALKWAVNEMMRRYQLLQEAETRDIHTYNQKVEKGKLKKRVAQDGDGSEFEKMPFVVIIIDELADLMAQHGKEVEGLIVRLAQMARAVGIHLIVSTQRPSVEVLTGLIKANITTRIAFQVATQIDSRTILDMGGAEKLLGYGDMLYLSSSAPQPKRVQGVYISEQEVKNIVKFIKQQASDSDFEDKEDLASSLEQQLTNSSGIFSGPDTEGEGDDELFAQAKEIVVQAGKASTSYLQRRLKVGYARAARLMDMLEESGVVGPADGAKPRQVLSGGSEPDYDDPMEDQAKRDNWSR